MKKIQLDSLVNEVLKCISIGEVSSVYLLRDGRILKLFNTSILQALKDIRVDIEKKILSSDNMKINSAIIRPEEAVYNRGQFVGDITRPARGISYNEWNSGLKFSDRANLRMYADMHFSLEKVVRDTRDIVYPDLCTCDNIYVVRTNNGYRVEFIDYDGLQVGSYQSISISTTLGDPVRYVSSYKYMRNGLFTKNLDKKSLILLYFLTTFNIDLNKVGQVNPSTGRVVTLEDIFRCINLDDNDVMHKVWKIFNEREQNEWLSDDVFRISDKYRLEVNSNPVMGNIYLKKLVKK